MYAIVVHIYKNNNEVNFINRYFEFIISNDKVYKRYKYNQK